MQECISPHRGLAAPLLCHCVGCLYTNDGVSFKNIKTRIIIIFKRYAFYSEKCCWIVYCSFGEWFLKVFSVRLRIHTPNFSRKQCSHESLIYKELETAIGAPSSPVINMTEWNLFQLMHSEDQTAKTKHTSPRTFFSYKSLD